MSDAAHGVKGPGYRPDIDGLRAIAVLAVLVYHAFPQVLPGGFVGVDIFFVISGYLITGILLASLANDRFSIADFYVRRIRRIFPALVVVLAAAMAAGWFLLVPDDYRLLGKHVLGGAGFVSNLVLWSESGYFDEAAEAKPLLHLWSLGIEEQFYLAWPLLLWVAWRARGRVALLVGGVLVASLAANLWLTPRDPVAAFYFPLTRFWELAIGGLLAAWRPGATAFGLPRRAAWIADPRLLSWSGAALIACSVAWLDPSMPFPGWRAIPPVLGAALLIAAGAGGPVNRHLLSLRAMVWIGLVSYPLYLWHWPILSFQNIVSIEAPPAWWRWAALGASVVLAAATYYLVERPVRFGGRPAWRAAGLGAAMAGTAAVGLVLHQLDGVADRFPGAVARYANYEYEYRTDARAGTCWINRKAAAEGFDSSCVDPAAGGRPLMVVWGDSHAARLFPGIREVAGDRFRLAQFTRDSCPPILSAKWPRTEKYPSCWKGNDVVLDRIRALEPEVVVLFAYWHAGWKRAWFKGRLVPTIEALRRSGVDRIIVVGPSPRWRKALPKLLVERGRRHPGPPPRYMGADLLPQTARVDAEGREVVESTGATWFSPRSVLCTDEGCLTYLGNDPDVLTTWDYGHLTTPAARLVAQALAKDTDGFLPADAGKSAATGASATSTAP
jgi:peptidoglycan/LPS O-acetylase OafA/YrhL